ncbi:MAG: LLM class flavin-dependent oxidoreductase [Acidobacteriota bacterium]|nr:LLM class flavin-dependent oxidoreductase [Acidobacteriota bacterium]
MTGVVPLSVLDLATVVAGGTPAQALSATTEMAVAAEELGYQRFWVAEHHAMPAVASSAPAVLIAHVANATSRLRVGAGGVMLPNHAPLVVAEQFATLEALHPGRIDLGLGRAPGTDHVTARALRRHGDLHATSFPRDVLELIGYLEPDDAPVHPAPTPGAGYLPQVWLLGSSTFSAHLAGQLGLPFSFAYHFAPDLLDEAVATYHREFRSSRYLATPHLMVAASVICADDDERARWLSGSSALNLLQRAKGRPGPLPSPEDAHDVALSDEEAAFVAASLATHFIGSADTVVRGLRQLVERTGADEIMVSTRVFDVGARRESLELLARHWMPDAARPATRERKDQRVS